MEQLREDIKKLIELTTQAIEEMDSFNLDKIRNTLFYGLEITKSIEDDGTRWRNVEVFLHPEKFVLHGNCWLSK